MTGMIFCSWLFLCKLCNWPPTQAAQSERNRSAGLTSSCRHLIEMQNGKIKSLKAANCLPQTHTSVVTQSGLRNLTHTSDVWSIYWGLPVTNLIKVNLALCFPEARVV